MATAKESLLAVGGLCGAVAASSCCVLPLALVSLGVSGAWIGKLTALAPYQPLFIAFATISLGAAFWFVYWPPQGACTTDVGAPSKFGRIVRNVLLVKVSLWLGTALVALSVGAGYGGALFL